MNTSWRIPLMALLVISLALSACGGGPGSGGNGDGGGEELPDAAVASSEDAEGTTYPLRAGRYRLTYRAAGCEDVVISVTSADFEYEQEPRGFSSFINDMPAGEYTVTVASECDEWTINLKEF